MTVSKSVQNFVSSSDPLNITVCNWKSTQKVVKKCVTGALHTTEIQCTLFLVLSSASEKQQRFDHKLSLHWTVEQSVLLKCFLLYCIFINIYKPPWFRGHRRCEHRHPFHRPPPCAPYHFSSSRCRPGARTSDSGCSPAPGRTGDRTPDWSSAPGWNSGQQSHSQRPNCPSTEFLARRKRSFCLASPLPAQRGGRACGWILCCWT